MRVSQKQLILQHLREKGSITSLEAIGVYRIYRLQARIDELRDQGYEIKTEMHRDVTGKRYARYCLATFVPKKKLSLLERIRMAIPVFRFA
jgi:hypothetical protein